jgi:APA family basic amino acid/polyamine antiporter
MPEDGLKRGLSFIDAAALVAGDMIGSGIFIVSADIARHVGTSGGLLGVWIASGLMTIAGAMAYGELAAMMPHAGGQYVFMREAYGGLWAFLYGWTLLLVIQTGTIAAVAVAFARFGGVLWPFLGEKLWFGFRGIGLSGERLGAITVIAVLTWANLRGLNLGRIVQNLFTGAKLISLLFIVALGIFIAPKSAAITANFGSIHAILGSGNYSIGSIASFGAAMVGGLFSADAWATVTFTAAEVRNPGRDMPRALAIGTGVVIVLYVLTNLAYMFQLPVAPRPDYAALGPVFGAGIAHAANDRVAAAAMRMVWAHGGAILTAILVMVSTFGCANGLIMTGARVVYAMSIDGVFVKPAGRLNRAMVPGVALIIQGAWAAILTLSGTYSELLDYVIFAQLLFYVLTVAAVFILRRSLPDAPRPYRAWGYPIVPGLYIIAAAALLIDLLIVKPGYTWPGLLIVLSGVPIYRIAVNRRQSTAI